MRKDTTLPVYKAKLQSWDRFILIIGTLKHEKMGFGEMLAWLPIAPGLKRRYFAYIIHDTLFEKPWYLNN